MGDGRSDEEMNGYENSHEVHMLQIRLANGRGGIVED